MTPEMFNSASHFMMLAVALSVVWLAIKVVTRPHKRSKADQIVMDSQQKIINRYEVDAIKVVDIVDDLKEQLAKFSSK